MCLDTSHYARLCQGIQVGPRLETNLNLQRAGCSKVAQQTGPPLGTAALRLSHTGYAVPPSLRHRTVQMLSNALSTNSGRLMPEMTAKTALSNRSTSWGSGSQRLHWPFRPRHRLPHDALSTNPGRLMPEVEAKTALLKNGSANS